MAALPTWFSQPREASPSSSSHLSLHLLLLQQLIQHRPRHQLRETRQLVVDAAAIVAQLREPAATSGQLPARLLWLRLIHFLQRLPVTHSATSCLHPLPLEGVGLCLWGGRRCPPSPPSTWMDPRLLLLLHHLPHHPLHSFATMTARTTTTAVTVESVLFSAKNTMDVIAVVKRAWT